MKNADSGAGGAALSREDFSDVYERYAPDLLKYFLASGMTVEDAQDTLHNSFLTLWELRDRISGPGALRPLWFTVGRHKMLDFFRRRGRLRPLSPDIDETPDRDAVPPSEEGDTAYLRRRISEALEKLPEDLAECYKLVKISGISIRETAGMTSLSESAVKSRIFRARKLLMAELADLENLF